ncbi:hypothetical protein D9601_19335 [Sphingomonas sp. MA1305]|nr:hypothetical protein [Sphingomonas sp. MA1305]
MKCSTTAKSSRRLWLEWLTEAAAMGLGALIILAVAWSKAPGLTYCGILLYGMGKVYRIAHRLK